MKSHFYPLIQKVLMGILSLFLGVTSVRGEVFKLSNLVGVEGNGNGGQFLVNNTKTVDRISITLNNTRPSGSIKHVWKINPETRTATVTGGYCDHKDREDIATNKTELKYLDGTNCVIRTEMKFLEDWYDGPVHEMFFPIKAGPAQTVYEIITADGIKKSLTPNDKYEMESFKNLRKVTILRGSIKWVIEPGKDSRLEIEDLRLKDVDLNKAAIRLRTLGVSVSHKKGAIKSIETKLSVFKN